jgi:AraC-like DNA-binding protein
MSERWSFQFEDRPGELQYQSGRVDFVDGPFRGSMEAVDLRPGFRLYVIDGVSTHPYAVTPRAVMPPGSIALGSMLSGDGTVFLDGVERDDWQERSIFAVSPEVPVSYRVRPGKHWSTVGMALSPDALAELAPDRDLPPVIRQTARGSATPLCLVRPTRNAASTHVAADILARRFHGRMAGLHRHAKTLEYLAHLICGLDCAPQGVQPLSPLEMRRVREARERLVADLRNPPDLHALAYAVGLGVKRLNEGFRALYGTTAFDYLRDMRLDEARSLLGDEPSLPLKQVAWQVGYSHPTNFINAYRKRFGVPPARDRRTRG